MKKQAERFKYIGLMLCCMGITAGCASGQDALQSTVQTSESQTKAQTDADAIQDGAQTELPDQTGQDTENVKAAELLEAFATASIAILPACHIPLDMFANVLLGYIKNENEED